MQRYFDQSATEQAVKVFEDLVGYSGGDRERALQYRRNAADVRTLFDRAALEPAGVLGDLPPLAEAIRREGESDAQALSALMDLVPYLTGVFGPYHLEFHHSDVPIEPSKGAIANVNGWKGVEFHDAAGDLIPNSQIVVKVRRREIIVVR